MKHFFYSTLISRNIFPIYFLQVDWFSIFFVTLLTRCFSSNFVCQRKEVRGSELWVDVSVCVRVMWVCVCVWYVCAMCEIEIDSRRPLIISNQSIKERERGREGRRKREIILQTKKLIYLFFEWNKNLRLDDKFGTEVLDIIQSNINFIPRWSSSKSSFRSKVEKSFYAHWEWT